MQRARATVILIQRSGIPELTVGAVERSGNWVDHGRQASSLEMAGVICQQAADSTPHGRRSDPTRCPRHGDIAFNAEVMARQRRQGSSHACRRWRWSDRLPVMNTRAGSLPECPQRTVGGLAEEPGLGLGSSCRATRARHSRQVLVGFGGVHERDVSRDRLGATQEGSAGRESVLAVVVPGCSQKEEWR